MDIERHGVLLGRDGAIGCVGGRIDAQEAPAGADAQDGQEARSNGAADSLLRALVEQRHLFDGQEGTGLLHRHGVTLGLQRHGCGPLQQGRPQPVPARPVP